MIKIMTIASLFLFSAAVHAEGWSTGVQYSKLSSELESRYLTSDTEPSGINILIGYEFSKYFAVEGLLGAGISDDNVERSSFDFELKYVNGISAIGILPITETFNFYGKLGVAQVKYNDSDEDTSGASGVMFGAGASISVTEQFGFNLEYVRYPDGEYNYIGIDVETSVLNFGGYFKF